MYCSFKYVSFIVCCCFILFACGGKTTQPSEGKTTLTQSHGDDSIARKAFEVRVENNELELQGSAFPKVIKVRGDFDSCDGDGWEVEGTIGVAIGLPTCSGITYKSIELDAGTKGQSVILQTNNSNSSYVDAQGKHWFFQSTEDGQAILTTHQ